MKTQKTSGKYVKQGLAAFWALLVLLQGALAGVPFNNLQGAGGVAFNPLAYPAGQNAAKDSTSPVSKPQFGAWYVNLGDVDVDNASDIERQRRSGIHGVERRNGMRNGRQIRVDRSSGPSAAGRTCFELKHLRWAFPHRRLCESD